LQPHPAAPSLHKEVLHLHRSRRAYASEGVNHETNQRSISQAGKGSGVDGVDQTQLPGQRVDGPDTAVVDAVDSVGGFIVDVGGGEDGSVTAAQIVFVESAQNATLAVFQPPL